MPATSSLVVGRLEDPHAAAVIATVQRFGSEPVVIDAASLRDVDLRLDDRGTALVVGDRPVELSRARGWLRRLAPEDWRRGVVSDGYEGVVRQAWTTALTTLVELAQIEWLSPLAPAFAAEEKLLQQRACRQLGVRFVPSVLATRPAGIPDRFGDRLVVKPLAAGHYFDNSGAARVVHATAMNRDDERLELLAGAPFLVQPRIDAAQHLRVVTVKDEVWVTALDAVELPLDWRESVEAHSSFKPANRPDVAGAALTIADSLGVGYSSQDWLVDEGGDAHFLDLNPAGQWLFLPDVVADQVTQSIARWLIRG